ncbi:MAG: CHAT domain-containing protein [Cyclobacteriaceae bacterium]
MIKYISLFITMFLLNLGSIAKDKAGDTTIADQWFDQANTQYEASEFDSALIYLGKAEVVYAKSAQWAKYYKCKFFEGQIWNVLGDTQKALKIFQENLKEARPKLEPDHPEIAEGNYNLGIVYSRLQKFKEAKIYFERALDQFTKYYGHSHHKVARSLGGLGYLFKLTNNYPLALENYKKAMSIFTATGYESSNSALEVYNNLAVIYGYMARFEDALTLYKKCLSITITNFGSNNHRLSTFYYNIGNNYDKKGDYSLALLYFKKVLDLDIKLLGSDHPYVSEDYITIAKIYDQSERFTYADEYYKKGIDICLKAHGNNHLKTAEAYYDYSQHFTTQGESGKAMNYLSRALNVIRQTGVDNHFVETKSLLGVGELLMKEHDLPKAEEYFLRAEKVLSNGTGIDNPYGATVYYNLGRIRLQRGHFNEALILFQRSLINLNQDFTNENIETNPDIDQATIQPLLFNILYAKASCFEAKYRKSNDPIDLEKGLATIQRSIRLLQIARSSYREENSKKGLLSDQYETYQLGINLAYKLYELSEKPEWIQVAFEITEKSKSTLLFESIKEREAGLFGDIPAKILAQEANLRSELAFYRNELRNAEKDQFETKRIKAIEARNFSLKQEYDSLVAEIEKNYPNYYSLKYDQGVIGITQVQSLLSDRTTLLEYFLGDSSLFIFATIQNKTIFRKLNIQDPFRVSISELRKATSQKMLDPEQFAKYSNILYNYLIAPVNQVINDNNLVVVADGILSYLPFELLIKDNSNNASYVDQDYLIRYNQIVYGYSATLFFDTSTQHSQKSEIENYLAFAPDFNKRDGNQISAQALALNEPVRGSLVELEGTSREVSNISELLGGQFYQGSMANELAFKQQAKDFSIIHLATHAIVDDQDPMNSRLLFTITDDTTEDGDLHAWELYNMQLNAKMAVLSACNTGFGKVQRGEGVMSLGRAFAYAGCPSIVMSLWPAQDQATADIMTHFYEGLSMGYSKDKALQEAKLKYLETAEDLFAHPFYWGGFVVQGDASPLHLKKTPSYWWIITCGLLIAVALSIVVYRKRRKPLSKGLESVS